MNEDAATDHPGATLTQFGADLRELRTAAGSPTYEAMARKAGLSLSLLSTVDKGRALPSHNALRGYLVALGQPDTEIEAWITRRDQVRNATQNGDSGAADQDPDDADPSQAAASGPSRRRGWLGAGAVLVCLALLVGGFAIGRSTALARSWWPGSAQSATSATSATSTTSATPATSTTAVAASKSPRVPVNGDDPYVAGCLDDAIPVAGTTQADGTVIQLMWSQTCSANWGRITLPQNANIAHASVTATVATTADEAKAQKSTVAGQQTVYTPILIVDVTEQACAAGQWAIDGVTASADQPACA